jgi:aminopeptidase
MDNRTKKLAEMLVNYSIRAKRGEVVLIRGNELCKPLAIAVYEAVVRAGAHPRMSIGFDECTELFYKHAGPDQLQFFPQINLFEAKHVDCLVSIISPSNLKSLSHVDPKKSVARARVLKPVNEWIMSKVRWVLVNYPVQALAQEAEMSLSEYEDFAYHACLQDWPKRVKEMSRIAKIFERGSEVLIQGKDTDLKLRIKGRKFLIGRGDFNMPDGEIFTGPIEDSAEGKIFYEFPAIHGGREVTGVRLWFEKGKVVKASATKNQEYLISMLDSDSGSRKLGELGIGLNYQIQQFCKDILFDEKIGGTIHLALGRSYPETGGKNQSAIHWDMIKDLRKGGSLHLDGKLIQKNGKYLV